MNGAQILTILNMIRDNQGDNLGATNDEVRDNTLALIAENICLGFGAGQQDAIAEQQEQYQPNNLNAGM